MNTTSISALSTIGIGAAATALVAGWSQAKNILARIIGLLIVTVEVRNGCYEAVSAFCWLKLKRSPSPFRFYTGRTRFIRPLGRYGAVAYEALGKKGQLFWKGRRPLWITLDSEYSDRAAFHFLRGMFDADTLIAEVMRTHASELQRDPSEDGLDRFRVYRMAGRSGKDLMGSAMGQGIKGGDGSDTPGNNKLVETSSESVEGRLVGWDRAEIGEVIPKQNPIGRLSLTPEVEEVIEEVRRWYASKDWYADRQIPWRRGLLLYGQPGTGKSSLTKALAQDLKIPIYLFDISTMDNQEFHKAWREALSNTPAIALIEDIDAVFHGRENIVAEKGQGLTYDCLLNTISGVESADGLLLIVTTNCLEHVDAALGIPSPGSTSSRPGRIDRAVELPCLDSMGRLKLAKRILTGCDSSWITYLVNQGANDTGAQFEDRCATVALNLFWSDNPQLPAPINGHAHEAVAVDVVIAKKLTPHQEVG